MRRMIGSQPEISKNICKWESSLEFIPEQVGSLSSEKPHTMVLGRETRNRVNLLEIGPEDPKVILK